MSEFSKPGLTTVGSGEIVDGSIVNADVNTSAAIALSKLAALTASKAVVSNGSGVLASLSTVEMGTLDGFSRSQIWNFGTSSILRLGSATADGDASNVVSEGAVIYDPTASTFARVKADRFGLAQLSSGGYYFRVDGTALQYNQGAGGAGTKNLYIDRASGNIGIGMQTPNLGLLEVHTGTGVGNAITVSSGTQFVRLFANDASHPVIGFSSGARLRIGPNSLDGGSFTEYISVLDSGFTGFNEPAPSNRVTIGANADTTNVNLRINGLAAAGAAFVASDGFITVNFNGTNVEIPFRNA